MTLSRVCFQCFILSAITTDLSLATIEWIKRPDSNDTYIIHDFHASWSSARLRCQILGGDLVDIKSSSENNWLLDQLTDQGRDLWWIGLTDWKQEGHFKWIDDSEFDEDFLNWSAFQPDNGGDQCAEYISKAELFIDVNCNHPRCSLCRNEFQKSARAVWNTKLMSWQDAYEECAKNNTHLYWVESPEDMDKFRVTALTSDNPSCEIFWVGLREVGEKWTWTNRNSPTLFDVQMIPWVKGTPDDMIEEDCVAMKKGNGLLGDYSCYREFSFVCKKNEDGLGTSNVEFESTITKSVETSATQKTVETTTGQQEEAAEVSKPLHNNIGQSFAIDLLSLFIGNIVGIIVTVFMVVKLYPGARPTNHKPSPKVPLATAT